MTAAEVTLLVFIVLSLLFPPRADLITTTLFILMTAASTFVILRILATIKSFGKKLLLRRTTGKKWDRVVSSYEGQSIARPTSAIAAVAGRKRREHRTSSLFLVGTMAAYLVFADLAGEEISHLVVWLLGFAIAAINVAAIAIEYRIRTGSYGTNEYEAREIIRYVIDNADKIDLSGGLGSTALSPAEISEVPVPQGLRGAHS